MVLIFFIHLCSFSTDQYPNHTQLLPYLQVQFLEHLPLSLLVTSLLKPSFIHIYLYLTKLQQTMYNYQPQILIFKKLALCRRSIIQHAMLRQPHQKFSSSASRRQNMPGLKGKKSGSVTV